MSSVRSLLAVSLAALACVACCVGVAQAAPSNMVALGVGAQANTLYRFSGEAPGVVGAVPITGFGSSTLVGIDYRPATLGLYGLGVEGSVASLFTIDPTTGAATLVGVATVPLISSATTFGIGFNPAADRLRVITDGAGGSPTNLRVNPNNGSAVGPPFDGTLDFLGLPGGNTEAPEVAIAYDRDFAGSTATTLYGIVSGGDRLVTQGNIDGKPANANTGTLFNVGPLGVDVSNNAGLDIDPATGEAYAALEVGGSSGLYRIDLATGAASSAGQIGDGSVDFASLTIGGPPFSPPSPAPPPPTPEPTLQALSVAPRAFAAAGGAKAKATTSARKTPVGTTIGYTVSVAATVSFAVERKTTGRKVGKACKPRNRGNADHKPCPIWKTLKAGFSHAGAAGPNAFKFNGKLGGKPLGPGNYKLLAGTGSSSLSAPFRILP